MQYVTQLPAPSLRPFVKHYWLMMLNAEESLGRQRLVPSGCMELTFQLSNPVYANKLGTNAHPKVLLCGQRNTFTDVWTHHPIAMLSVTFTPLGAFRFFKFPQHEIQNTHIDLVGSNLLPVTDLYEQLGNAASFHEHTTILNNYFINRLAKPTNDYLPRMAPVVQTIGALSETPSINQLATKACLSRKQFERLFTASVGLTPHQFVRVVRFQRALHLQQTQHFSHLTQLAYAAGYYDQSHLIAEFKSFSGLTPTQYFDMCEPISDYFA